MKKCYLGVVSLALISLTGCATMMTEKTQKLDFKSKPAGAEVVLGVKTCVTPCTIEIDKSKYLFQAMIVKDGYQSQTIFLNAKPEPMTYLNILNMGFGVIVDGVTGTIIKYEPEYYVILGKR